MIDFEYRDAYTIRDLEKLIAALRGEGGCPWDQAQTHESIRRNFIEETYEACEAIDEGDPLHLREELGDVLIQVLFHARIEEEAGRSNLDDIADATCRKLLFRHPHVFGDLKLSGEAQALAAWDERKRLEKSQETTTAAMASVAKSLPALWRAEKIQAKAQKVGFDWPSAQGALDKLSEELVELSEAVSEKSRVAEELGDLLFSAVNVARFSGIDPEEALHSACDKFTERFRYLEEAALKNGTPLSALSLDEMEALYQEGKQWLKCAEDSPCALSNTSNFQKKN